MDDEAALRAFVGLHRPALEGDEVRYGLMLASLARSSSADFRYWSLGAPGACAVQWLPYPNLVLGRLTEQDAHRLAEQTAGLSYTGVVGSDSAPVWFAERAQQLGIQFSERVPMRILAVQGTPDRPAIRGQARRGGGRDAELYARWQLGFHEEAIPNDPRPTVEALKQEAATREFMLWEVDGEPASMAMPTRRLRISAGINGVYTPPHLRGRGYAGAVTAALAGSLIAEGRQTVCLYVDLRNPFSNRCYARIGFQPVCDAWHLSR